MNYAVFLFPQALEALGEAIKPYLRDGNGGVHIVCAEVDASGPLFGMTLVGTGPEKERLELEIAPTLWQNITVNGMVPTPEKESGEDRNFTFQFGPLKPGQDALIKVSAQINPRLFGHVEGEIRLKDAGRPLAAMHRSMKVLF